MEKKLIPTIIQDYKTNDVYMLGFSTTESLKKTKKTGLVHFWSRSRKKLWRKGEESGNSLQIKEIFFDCDNDSLLFKVKLIGKYTCHKNRTSCFFNKYDDIK
ncbi:phosphoribosyl-AMP cyclohydrolase [Candidatus Roizmanbacteria bacterium RIFCSPHIGHO2_02_FULL_37_13b]|uniref:Histidine biosynthesis bifunctional protein HisIE n=1 Tax=Candidatus Roizmanbacteria bacterium RIFCSPLOWO2_02_FULL_36_11 TaxID=1802071 RepID=A0A1F7JCD1_9BACT|nr:MAG: phosphoribosyl-AMP cyclohydrolase [Candidatus Roizmanbacteria bacterium RIFCSPHIGHO2_02_FULL_37_13b]OGK53272.1 MAG: phosphoribosyl-AMP cyclohydrolase [Candidatus Roizmanbacteria bacterium RIFCSPLOWO2_02_FULL_36_11]